MRKDVKQRKELYDVHIIRGYEEGKSVQQLADELGINPQKVKHIAAINGVTKLWKHTEESFVEKAREIHGDSYDYSKVVYVGNKSKVTIVCPTHGEFSQTPHMHISKKRQGCPSCSISSIHRSVLRILDKNGIDYLVNDRSILDGKELDVYLPLHKVALEINGEYYHTHDKLEDRYYHYNKFKQCENSGISLLQFWGFEINNKLGLVESMILSRLGLCTRKIHARKCDIRHIDSTTYKDFLAENHLEGVKNSSIRLGLYLGQELVSVMGFSVNRLGYDYELDRFCSLSGTQVVGGFSKLLKHRPGGRIVSYSFNRYSQGHVYKSNGFSFVRENKTTLFYYHKGELKNRNSFMKYKLRKKLGIPPEDPRTEGELAREIGALQVFDAGTRTWMLN